MLQNYRTSRIYKGRNLHECAVLSRTGAGSENGGSLRGHFLRIKKSCVEKSKEIPLCKK